jgi:hypothetical protein
MNATLSLSLKRLILPGELWSLDVDLRYLPVSRFLKQHAQDATVLEVGSSNTGITPYVNTIIVGTDTTFPSHIASRLLPVVARGLLPFRDRSFDVVLSLDTLEHVPRDFRQLFINEMVRIARRYVVVGFPEGDDAERHDSAMEKYYVNQHGLAHGFFVEHREYGIPRREDTARYFDETKRSLAREFEINCIKNVNIRLRSLFMRTVWNDNRLIQRLYTLLTALSRWDWMFHYGRCYRSIYFLIMQHNDQ